MNKSLPADNPGLDYSGRVVLTDGHCRFDWPNTELRFTLTGSSTLSVKMNGAHNFFNIHIGDQITVLSTNDQIQDYLLSADLDPDAHTPIRLVKRTEAVASFPDRVTGIVQVDGISIDDSGVILPGKPRRPVIEFVGDSDTAAYGNLGHRTGFNPEDRSVLTDPGKQDAAQSWANFCALAFDADCHNISYSGMGAIWNSPGHGANGAMNKFYRQLLVNDDSSMVSDAQPLPPADLLVLYIGGNDWWTLDDRGDAPFIEGYTRFLEDIRVLRPTQPILIAAADACSGSCLLSHARQKKFSDDMKRIITPAVEQVGGTDNRVFLREIVPRPAIDVSDDSDWGLMEHWSVSANQKWARGVIPHIREITGWPLAPDGQVL